MADGQPDGTPKTFTQDEVNALLAKEKRDAQTKTAEALKELELLKSKNDFTAETRKQLEASIDQLQQQLSTKEELAKQQIERTQKELSAKLAAFEQENNALKMSRDADIIERALHSASTEKGHVAYNPDQVIEILKGKTRFITEKNPDGKESRRPVVNIVDGEKTLVLSPSEAVAHLANNDKYSNLFINEETRGLNLSSGKGRPAANTIEEIVATGDREKLREAIVKIAPDLK